MRLEKDSYFCFKSKRYDIRYADNLVRHVNKLFPRTSVTKAYCYDNYDNSRFNTCSNTCKNLRKKVYSPDLLIQLKEVVVFLDQEEYMNQVQCLYFQFSVYI